MPPDLFSEVELGEQRPKDAAGSSVPLARDSGDSLVDLHEGGRSSGEDHGGGGGAARRGVGVDSSTPSRRRRPWSSWPHPLCNVAAIALGLLSAVLLVTTLVSSSSSRASNRGPLLAAGQGCGNDKNCVASDGSLAPEGGLHSSVSLAAARDFRGRPRSVIAASANSSSSSKNASARATGGGGIGSGILAGAAGGVVAADHGRCSDVGASVLSRGGNAADAAVAAALCQGVYNPMASGIGGGTIIMWRKGKGRARRRKGRGGGSPSSQSLGDEEVIDGRETAPAAASAAAFERGDPSLSLDGGLAVATPMELAALSALFERHGSKKVPWRELVAPAARAAREGFDAHPYYISAVSGPRTLEMLRRSPELREAFLVRDPRAKEKEKKKTKKREDGGSGKDEEDEEGRNWRPPRVGERCCARPALADTLEAVGKEGALRAFYRSERAEQIAEDVRSAGGVLSAEDLRDAAPRVARPLRSRARSSPSSSSSSSSSPSSPLWGMTLLVPPPPSAGASLLLAAAVAAGFEQPLPFARGLGSHRLVEAMKHGMALRAALGDPGGGETVAFGCGADVTAESDKEKENGGRRSLLAAADDDACGAAPSPSPPPPLFEGTSHVRALLSDAADPSFAGLLRSEVNDSSTLRDPASYGGRWGVGGGGDGNGGGSGGGGGRRRRGGRKHLLSSPPSSPSSTAALVSLPPDDHGTSALVVVDADRNAVSLTTTVNTAFGSGVYSRRTGVLLNNQMDDFSVRGRSNGYGLPPGPANFVEPGKRPLSSMAPCMLVQEEEEEEEEGEEREGNGNAADDPTHGLRLVAGASGGPRILTALLQALVSVVEGGAGPLEAVSAPRLHHQLLPAEVFAERWDAGGIREEVPRKTLDALEARGHAVKSAGWGAVVQAIVVPAGGGPLEAACDPRKDGAPAVAL